jgi:hypothetical protein
MAQASEHRTLSKRLSHLSYTSMSTAEHCLRMFYATRMVEKTPRVPEKARESGKLIHAMIEQYLHGRDPMEARLSCENIAYFDECAAVFAGWKSRFTIPPERWFAAEHYGRCTVPGVPVEIVGFDDFVYEDDGWLVLRDFKTGWAAEMQPDFLFQGDLSCLRLAAKYPDRADRMASEVEFVRSGVMSERRPWTSELHEKTVGRVQRIWRLLERAYRKRDGWETTPGSHCRFCPLNVSCASATATFLREEELLSEHDALRALQQIALFEHAREKLVKSLKHYVDEYGPVTMNGYKPITAGYPQPKPHAKIRDVRAVIERIGLDAIPAGVLKLDLDLKAAATLLEDRRLSDLISSAPTPARFSIGTANQEVP